MQRTSPLLVLVLFVLAGGCTDNANPPVSSSAGNGAGQAGNAAASGGSGVTGGTGTAGANATVAGAGAGGANTLGGAAQAGDGGASAGSGGAAGLLALATQIHQFRLECPCIDADHFGLDKLDNCDATPAVDRQTFAKKMGGDPNVTYDVTLRVRGNTEPNTYVNGKLEQERFYTGGETSTPGYTAYMLSVAEPKEVYFFNYHPTTGHIHFLIDYEVVIPMKGGTTVTFEVNGGKSVPDGHGVSNREALVVPDVAPAPDPFNGQLVQFDVVSVKAR